MQAVSNLFGCSGSSSVSSKKIEVNEKKPFCSTALTITGLVGAGVIAFAVIIVPGSLGVAGHFAKAPFFFKQITALITLPGSAAVMTVGIVTELGIVGVAIFVFRGRPEKGPQMVMEPEGVSSVQPEQVKIDYYTINKNSDYKSLDAELKENQYCLVYYGSRVSKVQKGSWGIATLEEGSSVVDTSSVHGFMENSKEAAIRWAQSRFQGYERVFIN